MCKKLFLRWKVEYSHFYQLIESWTIIEPNSFIFRTLGTFRYGIGKRTSLCNNINTKPFRWFSEITDFFRNFSGFG